MTQDQANGQRKPAATRADVAKAAGVSVTTVTHALNPPAGARVKESTVERVRRAAASLGYRPNFAGRALVSGKTFAIGLLQPDFSDLGYGLYYRIIASMAAMMDADDYHLLLLMQKAKNRYMDCLNQGRIDGMFILQSGTHSDHIERVIDTGIATVVVNRQYDPPQDRPAGCVSSDHAGLMRDVVDELAHLGCHNLASIIDTSFVDANVCMQRCFLAEIGERMSSRLSGQPIEPSPEGFGRQIRTVLESASRPDGFFVDDLPFADVLLDVAHDMGLTPGEDFHLITASTEAGLTTERREEQSVYVTRSSELGQRAWQVMKALIEGRETERVVRVPYDRAPISSA